jgi:hypothetical protein
MDITAPEATLIAATAAAIASISSLVVNIYFQGQAERRISYRKSLEAFLPELAKALYTTMASSNVLAKIPSDTSKYVNWRKRAGEARKSLHELRYQVRYQLWGLDDGLRTLTRIPNWIEHARGRDELVSALLIEATGLRELIDEVIRKAYAKGSPPNWWQRRKVLHRTQNLRKLYEDSAPEGFRQKETDEAD